MLIFYSVDQSLNPVEAHILAVKFVLEKNDKNKNRVSPF